MSKIGEWYGRKERDTEGLEDTTGQNQAEGWKKRTGKYFSMGFNVQSLNIKRKSFIDMYSKYESFEYKNF